MARAISGERDAVVERVTANQQPRPFWLVVATLGMASLLGALNNMSLNAFLPFIAEDFGRSIPTMGQITTVVAILGALTGLVVGPLADRYGQRRFLLIGGTAVIVTAIGSSLATSFGTLLAARLVSAFFGGMLQSTSLAMVALLYDGEQRRRAMGWVIGGMACAPIVGLPLLAFVESFSSWRWAFITVGVLAIGIIVLIRLVLPGSPERETRQRAFRLTDVLRAYGSIVESGTMRTLYAATFTRAACWMGFLAYFGAFLRHTYNADARTIGWAYMAAGGGYFAGSLLAGGRFKNVGLRPLYGVASLTMAPLLSVALALSLGLVASAAILTVAAIVGSASWVSLTTLLANESSAGRSTTMSLNSTVVGLGTATGAAIGGVLISFGGYEVLGLGLAGFIIISGLLVWRPIGGTSVSEVVPEGNQA